jgi:imidazolonepropionase-like amidohydrolase
MWVALALAAAVTAALAAFVWTKIRPPSTATAGLIAVAGPDLVLRGVTVINPGSGRRENCVVTIRGGRIVEVAAEAAGDASAGAGDAPATPANPASTVEAAYRGAFLLPGLVDMHTHLPPASPLNLTSYFCLLYLLHGVTTLRDCGDVDGTAVPSARRALERGELPGPRVFACGPFISGGPPRWVNTVVVEGPDEMEGVVAKLSAAGADFLKAYEDLTVAEIRALVAAGQRHGLPVIGHVPAALSYEEALIPEVQHFLGVPLPASHERDHIVTRMEGWQGVDDARLDEIVAVTLEHGIVNTPTLVTTRQILAYRDYAAALADPVIRLLPRLYREAMWHPRKGLPFFRVIDAGLLARAEDSLHKKKRLLARLFAAGARLLIGTDTSQPFVIPGVALQQEMRLFAEAGVPPETVWAIATRVAGETLRQPQLGRIEPGAPADLLLFRADPTADLAALGSLDAVIAAGKLFRCADIAAAVEVYRRHFKGGLVDRLSMLAARYKVKRIVRRDY